MNGDKNRKWLIKTTEEDDNEDVSASLAAAKETGIRAAVAALLPRLDGEQNLRPFLHGKMFSLYSQMA